jgi:3-hydroxyacyl-CoA dehydrogenase
MFEINTGSAAGPFRMMDRVGLDVVLDIEEHYCAEHPEYPEGPRKLLRSYLEQGRLGVKSGRVSTTTTRDDRSRPGLRITGYKPVATMDSDDPGHRFGGNDDRRAHRAVHRRYP